MTTMNDLYGDGSDHEACSQCHYCLVCGDCELYGCGEKYRKVVRKGIERLMESSS